MVEFRYIEETAVGPELVVTLEKPTGNEDAGTELEVLFENPVGEPEAEGVDLGLLPPFLPPPLGSPKGGIVPVMFNEFVGVDDGGIGLVVVLVVELFGG